MTLEEVRSRIADLQAELRQLREQEWTLTGVRFIPGFGPIGTSGPDEMDLEAARLGREYRDHVNRESLEEMDREETEAAAKSWLDLYGRYPDDPAFEEATRLGREYREQVNRESLEELDREEAAELVKKATEPRGKDAAA